MQFGTVSLGRRHRSQVALIGTQDGFGSPYGDAEGSGLGRCWQALGRAPMQAARLLSLQSSPALRGADQRIRPSREGATTLGAVAARYADALRD
jgi:hypothetical protein